MLIKRSISYTVLAVASLIFARMHAAAVTPDVTPIVWQAKWIAAPGADPRKDVMPLFRKSFSLPKRPSHAIVYVSALRKGKST